MTPRALVLVIALVAVASCTRPRIIPRLTSFSPADAPLGSVINDTMPMSFQFSAPMVTAAEVGAELGPPFSVVITPPLPTRAHWSDRQTLVVSPTQPYHRGTRYKIKLGGTLAAAAPTQSFVYRPLNVFVVRPDELSQAPLDPVITVEANQPLSPEILPHCQLGGASGNIALALLDTADPVGGRFALTPQKPLERDHAYVLTCAQLMPSDGNEPLSQPLVVPLHTQPAFRLLSSAPAGRDVSASDAQIGLVFSTPVELDDVRKHLSSKPSIRALRQGQLDPTHTHYTARVDLDTDTDYQIELAAGLRDRFGQTLEAAKFAFHSGDAEPKLSLETGIFTVETARAGYPIWTRNVDEVDITCARVPQAQIVKLLTSTMHYDPWYDASGTLDWKDFGLHARTSTRKPKAKRNSWHLDEVPLGETCGGKRGPGLYLAEVSTPRVDTRSRSYGDHRVLANVTDLGLLLKTGNRSGLIWVTSISSGTPVAEAEVVVFRPSGGKAAFRGKTDASGLLRLPGIVTLLGAGKERIDDSSDEEAEFRGRRLIVTVEKAGDMAVVDGNWQNGVQIWNFGLAADRSLTSNAMRGFIQSDRGLYRPGETVAFKGLVREMGVGIPKGKVEVTVTDARAKEVFHERRPLSAFGGFWFQLPLGAEASVGEYTVQAKLAGTTFHEQFLVEEFRKAELEIRPLGAVHNQALKKRVEFKFEAAYLFGAPVSNTKVAWSVSRRARHFTHPRLPEFTFEQNRSWWDWHYDSRDSGHVIDEGEVETDKTGHFRFRVVADKADGGPQDYIARATIEGPSGQTTTKSTVVTVHETDRYVGLQAQEYVQAVAMPFSVNLVAVDLDGNQVAGTAELSAVQVRQHCTPDPSVYRWRQNCTEEKVPLFRRQVALSPTGAVAERINPTEAGQLEIAIEMPDTTGKMARAATTIWVIGAGEAFWSGDESDRMSLVASKREYHVGDVAKLVPRAGFDPSAALVTLERDGILEAWVTDPRKSGLGVEIPVNGTLAPNVFASVAVVRGRVGDGDRLRPRFRMGMTELVVSAESERLDIAIDTGRKEFRPGDTVSGILRVSHHGQPIAAEVSLSVADEAVLQVIDYHTPDPMKAFYATWALGVETATTLNRIARLRDPNEADPDEGGDGPQHAPDRIRSRFLSSVFWKPALVTDDKGEAGFTFVLPDNLTSFRFMAVAADHDLHFGSADTRIVVKKPLVTQPVLPRFLSAGDRAEVGVVVRNLSGQAGTLTLTAEATGARLSSTTATAKVADNGEARLHFTATALDAEKATFRFHASLGDEKDSLELTVPVARHLQLDKTSLSRGELKGAVDVPVAWAPVLRDAGYLEISADQSGLSSLGGTLRELIQYPYGCLEQTLSGFIPLTKVADLANSLDLPELKTTALKTYIRIGAAKVVRHQHPDGHFSLWPGAQPEPHLTVYALYGLDEARRAGVTVDQEAVKRGLAAMSAWARANVRLTSGYDLGTVAQAIYVLDEFGYPDPGLEQQLFATRRTMPVYGQAYLLMALGNNPHMKTETNTLADELLALLTVDGKGLAVSEPLAGGAYYMSSDTRSTAIVLRALLRVRPKSVAIAALARTLLARQRSDGSWRSTQESSQALVALADLARADARRAPVHLKVTLGGKRLAAATVKGSGVFHLRVALTDVQPGTLRLESDGLVQYQMRLVQASRPDHAKAVGHGLGIVRTYEDAITGSELTQVKAGQQVKVRLIVTADADQTRIAVHDPLPAGLEPVVPELERRDPDLEQQRREEARWSPPDWVFSELRDDRALAFADRLSAGTHVFEYLTTATTTGHFEAAAPTVENMYDPDIYARGVGGSFDIKSR